MERVEWSAQKLADYLGVGRESIYKWREGTQPSNPDIYIKLKDWIDNYVPVEGEQPVKPKKKTVIKSNGIATDYQEKYIALLEQTNRTLQETINKLLKA